MKQNWTSLKLWCLTTLTSKYVLIQLSFIKFAMDPNQRKQDQNEIEAYLESKKVYHLFDDLLKSLCINKPKNPIDFLIQKLEEP